MQQDDWRQWLDAATNLTPGQRDAVRGAIASSVLEGWTPDRRAVELLTQFGSGTITFTEYRSAVLREAVIGRLSTQEIVEETCAGAKHSSP